ncbi:phage terminase large subunit [Neisseria shayeganii]|uniref:Phage terminase large subunit n=1 Tax=Neisseria shayeganii TaxID=607712 RepID=A0A7D7S4I0_9NEIS|nr:phage terminase large subunit [Neisseria shayeganii]QMT39986.1 phage terminase large subunit [Neisseria shayeganii]
MKNKEFLKSLTALSDQLRQIIEAEVVGFNPSPAAIAERRAKVFDPVHGYEYFVNTYFPHYVRAAEKSDLHRYLFRRLPEMLRSEKGEPDAIGAPRGEGKSTLVTQLFSLWCIVTGRKHYIVIVMDSIDQAYPMLEAIKAELEFNPRLRTDFGEAVGQGRVWQAGTIVTAGDIKVQVAGSGKKLRGLRHGPYRPDLTILDDIENDEQVRSPEQRDKLNAWLTKTVLPLGGVGQKYDVVYIGTILHYDSVLARTLKNPFWTTVKFKAMLSWPDRMDLWDRWEELYRNDGEAVADAYYQAHQAEMEVGAQTSWAARGVLALMKIRARDGHATFDSEYQNDPVSGDAAPFAESLCFWVQRDDKWVFYGACDPSLGKAGASRDPSAILVGGFNRQTGVLDVVEARIHKRLPDRIIEDVIALQKVFRCLLWGIETVQFQEFLKTELVKRGAAAGVPVPARGIKPVSDKLLRIESLQPHMANGLIRLHSSQSTLIEQLRHFPMADHDDGPDALHMLWMLATSGFGAVDYIPVPRREGGGDGVLSFGGGAW